MQMDMDKIFQKMMGCSAEEGFARLREYSRKWEAIRATWLPKWELGDVIMVSSPLAGTFRDDGELHVEAFQLVIVKQHPDDAELFYATMVDCNDSQYLRCGIDVDIHIDNGMNLHRVYPMLGMWIHALDMDFANRIAKIPEIVPEVQKALHRLIVENYFPEDYDDDDFYLEMVEEMRRHLEAYEDMIQAE